jgi:predicted nucleotidyltransferase
MAVDYETAKKIIDQYISDVKAVMPINKVFLYGSFANGTAKWDSDIDLCFFSDSFENKNIMHTIERRVELKRQ